MLSATKQALSIGFATIVGQIYVCKRLYGLIWPSFFLLFFFLDHVAKRGGKIVLMTYGRSGSSFTSEVIQQDPQVFYTFEPLYNLVRRFYKRDPGGRKSWEISRSLFLLFLFDCLFDWLADWLAGWLAGWLIDWMAISVVAWFIDVVSEWNRVWIGSVTPGAPTYVRTHV